MLREEALLTNVAPLPVLSGTLRSRVLAAAGAARSRRVRARRALASGFVLFGVLGWISWSGCLPFTTRSVSVTEAGLVNASSASNSAAIQSPAAPAAYCRRDMLISAMGDDWRMVEAELKSREEFTRRAQM